MTLSAMVVEVDPLSFLSGSENWVTGPLAFIAPQGMRKPPPPWRALT